MTNNLQQTRVAFLVANGFEQVELTSPKQAVEQQGGQTAIVSPADGQVQGFNHFQRADQFDVDLSLDEAQPEKFDALVLPGGAWNPDQLRSDEQALDFVRHFFEENKLVAVICHGPWTLVNAGVLPGRRLTSWPSIELDLRNAGAAWVDQQVVEDDNFISSRKPDDLPAFNETLLRSLAQQFIQSSSE